jgi:hypothetical protein
VPSVFDSKSWKRCPGDTLAEPLAILRHPEALARNFENACQLLRSYCADTRRAFSLIGKIGRQLKQKRSLGNAFQGMITEVAPENVYSFDFPLSCSALVWRSQA